MNRILLFTVILVLAVGGGYLVARPFSEVVQPIAFNHKVHIDNGLDCSACHERYSQAAVAGRPKLTTCLFCHETPLTESPEEEKVRQYAERGEEIPWRRLTRLPAHVYFSHRRHVVLGGIACQTCHGHIGQSTSPPSRPEIQLKMNDCLACHRQHGVTTDCNACHR